MEDRAAAAESIALPLLNQDGWQVEAASLAEKRALLNYAAKAGMPIDKACRRDDDLFIECWQSEGLLWTEPKKRSWRQLTPAEFRSMCDTYAASQH